LCLLYILKALPWPKTDCLCTAWHALSMHNLSTSFTSTNQKLQKVHTVMQWSVTWHKLDCEATSTVMSGYLYTAQSIVLCKHWLARRGYKRNYSASQRIIEAQLVRSYLCVIMSTRTWHMICDLLWWHGSKYRDSTLSRQCCCWWWRICKGHSKVKQIHKCRNPIHMLACRQMSHFHEVQSACTSYLILYDSNQSSAKMSDPFCGI